MRLRWFYIPFFAASLLFCAGCGKAFSTTDRPLYSPTPAHRLEAIRQAGLAQDPDAIARLIELLDSDDPAERLMCIVALEHITGKRLGYNPYVSPTQRDQAIQRWVQAYRQGRLP